MSGLTAFASGLGVCVKMAKAISLSRGVRAIIDDDDFELVSLYRWYASNPRRKRGHYVMCSINGKTVYLHRFLMGATSGQVVDHVNGDGLDNRRSNLRVVAAKDYDREAKARYGKFSRLNCPEDEA